MSHTSCFSFMVRSISRFMLSKFTQTLQHLIQTRNKQKQEIIQASGVGDFFPMSLSSCWPLPVNGPLLSGVSLRWLQTHWWEGNDGEPAAARPSVPGYTWVWGELTAEHGTCCPPRGISPLPNLGTSWTDCQQGMRCTAPHNPLWRQRKWLWGLPPCSEWCHHCSQRYLTQRKLM